MPQKSMANPKNWKQNNNQSDVKFIDLSLDKSQEKAMIASKFADTQYPRALDLLVKEGFKVTFKEDARNKSIMCMVQSASYDPDTTTIIWVMRSGSAAGALLKLSYFLAQSDGALPDDVLADGDDLSDDALFG